MAEFKKGKHTFGTVNEIQAAAFKAAGWNEVKPKANAKAKADKDAEPPADQPDQAEEGAAE